MSRRPAIRQRNRPSPRQPRPGRRPSRSVRPRTFPKPTPTASEEPATIAPAGNGRARRVESPDARGRGRGERPHGRRARDRIRYGTRGRSGSRYGHRRVRHRTLCIRSEGDRTLHVRRRIRGRPRTDRADRTRPRARPGLQLEHLAPGPVPAVIGPSRRRRTARAIPLLVPRSLLQRSPALETRTRPRGVLCGAPAAWAGSRGSTMRDPRRRGAATALGGRITSDPPGGHDRRRHRHEVGLAHRRQAHRTRPQPGYQVGFFRFSQASRAPLGRGTAESEKPGSLRHFRFSTRYSSPPSASYARWSWMIARSPSIFPDVLAAWHPRPSSGCSSSSARSTRHTTAAATGWGSGWRWSRAWWSCTTARSEPPSDEPGRGGWTAPSGCRLAGREKLGARKTGASQGARPHRSFPLPRSSLTPNPPPLAHVWGGSS